MDTYILDHSKEALKIIKREQERKFNHVPNVVISKSVRSALPQKEMVYLTLIGRLIGCRDR